MDEFDDPEVLAFTSPAFADVRIEAGLARAEFISAAAIRQTAELWGGVARILRDAEENPEVYLDLGASLTESQRRDYAVRSAAADIAVRLVVSENTVRGWASSAETLWTATPTVWTAFCEGTVAVANARVVAQLAVDIPAESHSVFDAALAGAATTLTPARFASIARAARARVLKESLAERHRRAANDRRVSVDDELDGMSWLSIYLPSATAHRAVAGIDAAARTMLGDDDRTLDQLRADVAGDLLTGCGSARAGVSVSVTVPVMTLLGCGDEPGVLHGVGPIDADTARLLAGEAPSLTRILTHPVTGVVLELDRTQYRVPAAMRRVLAARDKSCRFAGCGRRAANCDVDHVVEWHEGGSTDAANLMHLCRHHHRLKSVARWAARPPDPGSSSVSWTSPTGHTVDADPPPF